MPSGKPRPHRGAATQRHVTAVKQENRELQQRTLEGWRELTSRDAFPQLEELRRVCVDLLEARHPLKGRNLDTSRGGGEFISEDGRSTVEGRPTLSYRDRMEWMRRQLENILRSNADSQDERRTPYKGPARRRCQNQECDQRGRWHRGLHQFCGYCGEPMEEAAA